VACSNFRESERLDPGVGTLLNLADCEEKIGRLASAWQFWREAIDMMGQSDERLSYARGRSSALDRRVPRLTITLAGADGDATRVLRDDLELGSASLGSPLPVDPGSHVVRVTAAGFAESKVVVTVAEGERKSIEVKPGARIASPAVNAAAPASVAASQSKRTWGWISMAAGGAGVAGAVATGLIMAGHKNTVEEHCSQDHICDAVGYEAAQSGQKLLIPNAVLWGLGAAGVGVGAYLLLSSSHEGKTTTALTVRSANGGSMVSCEGRF
jgi:hypothetical protein